jgi:hypothetical protein
VTMKRMLKITKATMVSVLAVIGAFKLIGDADWTKSFWAGHPRTADFIHDWLILFVVLVTAVAVAIDHILDKPRLRVRVLAIQWCPRVWDVPLAVMDELQGRPANPDLRIDADLFAELYIVNQSDVGLGLEDFEATAIINGVKTVLTYANDFDLYELRELVVGRNVFSPIPALRDTTKGIVLDKGVPYQGWVRFTVKKMEQVEHPNVRVRIWVIDTLGGKHEAAHHERRQLLEEIQIVATRGTSPH